VQPKHGEVSAVLLVRAWVEQSEGAPVRFRVLATAPGRATRIVARGESRELLLTTVGEWVDGLVGPMKKPSDNGKG
jgi:hypothetical protein